MHSIFRGIGKGILVAALIGSGSAFAMDNTLNRQIEAAFENGELEGLHGVYAELAGEPIAEVYFKGRDERWGVPVGERLLGPDDLHDLRSVTKSIVGLLYGIALAEGKVPGPEEGLLAQFPQYADLADDPKRSAISIRDALTMKMGTEWNEDLPYTDPRNSEIAMELAQDRYRFILDRPMIEEPGNTWVYNGGATAIVAKLIADGTGMPIKDYAEKVLFRPLGITKFEWLGGRDGIESAASGLRLRTRDLARIGRMLVNGGTHEGVQVVPADWIAASFEPRAEVMTGLGYGYFWWLDGAADPPRWMGGFGNGGQRLQFQPDAGLVLVVFAGNYNDPEAWRIPVKVLMEFVIPDARRRLGKK